MAGNVELLRELLFLLETRELSPRSTVIIAVDVEALDIGCPSEEIVDGLNLLLDLDYIDGPGEDEPGFWFFRKLTRKGRKFLTAARHPADWEIIKRRFETQTSAQGA